MYRLGKSSSRHSSFVIPESSLQLSRPQERARIPAAESSRDNCNCYSCSPFLPSLARGQINEHRLQPVVRRRTHEKCRIWLASTVIICGRWRNYRVHASRRCDRDASGRELRASCALRAKLDVFCYSYSALDVAIPALFMRPLRATSSRRQVALELTLATLFCLMPLAWRRNRQQSTTPRPMHVTSFRSASNTRHVGVTANPR